jgi:hypothetical protein
VLPNQRLYLTPRRGTGIVTESVIGFGCLQFNTRFAAQVRRDR